MVVDYRKYAHFNYSQTPSEDDQYGLGDVVIKEGEGKEISEIGVIIQAHGNDEYRTCMFGNCCESEIRLATVEEIKTFRPQLLAEEIK